MSYDEHLISMAGGDGELDLAAIEARAASDRAHFANGNAFQLADSKDREYLLALVREQQAKLDRVEKVAKRELHDLPVWYSGFIRAYDVLAAITATEEGQ